MFTTRRSQVSPFLTRAGGTCTLDRRVNEKYKGFFMFFYPRSRLAVDKRVVAKQVIQEVESAK